MLSVFPELLIYGALGATIVRVVVGCALLYIGLMTVGIKRTSYTTEMTVNNFPFYNLLPWVFGLVEIIAGSFLIVGFLTQLMAAIGIYIFANLIFMEKHIGRVFDYPNIFYVVMIFVSAAILLLGPGIFAIDLPL